MESIIYIKPQLTPESVDPLMFRLRDITDIISGLRGPDSESTTAFPYQKLFGTAIIRNYVSGWDYGSMISPLSLKSYLNFPDLLEYLGKADHHYAMHMYESFQTLAAKFENARSSNEKWNCLELDIRFTNVMACLWDRIDDIQNKKAGKQFKIEAEKYIWEIVIPELEKILDEARIYSVDET